MAAFGYGDPWLWQLLAMVGHNLSYIPVILYCCFFLLIVSVVLQAFFRRSLCNKTDYKCAGNGDCVIQPGKRNTCSACRLRKCIASGMSISGVYFTYFTVA